MSVKFNLVGDWPTKVNQSMVVKVLDSLRSDLPAGEINIKLVDDNEITALNKQYSGNAYATDVLSFNYQENGQSDNHELGDIAISFETAERQAESAGTDLTTEIALLALHGLLHIAGYDHQTDSERNELEEIQARLMKQNGLTYREFKWQENQAL